MAESVLVSARVPQAKKDASKGVLASLGANTSDLINSAFDYLLERRELPTTAPASRPSWMPFWPLRHSMSIGGERRPMAIIAPS